jgi:hypothetical protein
MSRRRRRPSNNNNANSGNGNAGGGSSPSAAFWATAGEPAGPAEPIRPTSDPAALPRSLGDPPLTPEAAAQQALAVVYEEAVRAATALAAVNGLLAGDPDATGVGAGGAAVGIGEDDGAE